MISEAEIKEKIEAKLKPVEYEIVQKKNGTTFLRRVPSGRTLETASKRRLANLLQLAEISSVGYNKTFEEHIDIIKKGMKPIGREIKTRELTLSQRMLADIKNQMLKRGITQITLPPGYKVKVVD